MIVTHLALDLCILTGDQSTPVWVINQKCIKNSDLFSTIKWEMKESVYMEGFNLSNINSHCLEVQPPSFPDILHAHDWICIYHQLAIIFILIRTVNCYIIFIFMLYWLGRSPEKLGLKWSKKTFKRLNSPTTKCQI